MYRGLTEQPYQTNSSNRREDQTERRTNKRLAAFQSCFRNRRKDSRRDTDTLIDSYVDSHDKSLAYLAFGAMLFSIFDAFFTLQLIAHGSKELNPVMAFLIEHNVYYFLAFKFFVTGAGLSFLVMHRYHLLFNRISGYHLLVFCFACYFALMCYELTMIQHLTLIH